MIPPAILEVADRIVDLLMTLANPVGQLALAAARNPAPNPARNDVIAQTFFLRLQRFITAIIRLELTGFRAPRDPQLDTKPDTPRSPDPTDRATPAPRLPRRPGWLLAILPDIAPAIAVELGPILADPAFIALLDAAPSLHRTLRPILRALGLAPLPAPSAPTPDAPTPDAPHPKPPHTPPNPSAAPPTRSQPSRAPESKTNRHTPRSSLVIYVTIS